MWTLLFWLVGCGGAPSFNSVQEADTIEAYEQFLELDPDSIHKGTAEKRLEELLYERAMATNAVADWEKHVTRFPEGSHAQDAGRRLSLARFAEARQANTAEAYQALLAEPEKLDRRTLERVRGALAALEYGKIAIGASTVKPVNLAENPEGPMDGMGIFLDVTNNGDKTFVYVSITIDLISTTGQILDTQEYPVTSDKWVMPASDLQRTPMAPGETRTWEWTIENEKVPVEWGTERKVAAYVTGLREVGAAEPEAPKK